LPGSERRFGITTPRYAGIAARRNRFKRLLREAYRLNPNRIAVMGVLLVILKKTNDETGVSDEMFALAERAEQNFRRRELRKIS